MPQIEFTLMPDGSIEEHVIGAKGRECEGLTKPYEEALGGGVKERRRKPEYYQQAQKQTQTMGR